MTYHNEQSATYIIAFFIGNANMSDIQDTIGYI